MRPSSPPYPMTWWPPPPPGPPAPARTAPGAVAPPPPAVPDDLVAAAAARARAALDDVTRQIRAQVAASDQWGEERDLATRIDRAQRDRTAADQHVFDA